MKTKDHLALGRYLLQQTDSAALHQYSRAFLLGCVEPDYNMATYLRGFFCGKHFRGHNAENSFAFIARRLNAFAQRGFGGPVDCFTLGALLHYAADAFTWPHNGFSSGDLLFHATYEIKLHGLFKEALSKAAAGAPASAPASPVAYFENAHREYCKASRKMETDCRYIINACTALLFGCLRYAKRNEREEEQTVYEGAYHNGLVQTGR